MRALGLGLLMSLALVCSVTQAPAVEFELTPFYGYRLGGELEDIDVSADDSASYGASFGIALNEFNQIELLWSHQGTEVDIDDFQVAQQELQIDVDIDHYLVGWLGQTGNDKVKPFFTFHLGLLDISPEGFEGEDYFTWSLGGGAKVYASDVIGFRFQARWDLTYVDSDSAVYCGWYGYCFLGAESDYFNQMEFSAGMILRFGK